jgi:predicted amidohydrolase
MSHQLKVAAVQMNAEPALRDKRLGRAETLIARAASQGAQLVVLPEVFNTGYVYSDQNYRLAETLHGKTVTWMKSTAHKYNVYLSGCLLLREDDEIYDSLLLVSPDGQHWRYDKTYPWAWERAYFRGGRKPVVAETPLGRFGLLVCWDVAHTRLWAAYAGKVDAVLVSSCPPLLQKANTVFPDGKQLAVADTGAVMRSAFRGAEQTFGEFLRRQAAWLGVPLVIASGSGKFSTHIPRPRLSTAVFFAMRPRFWKYIPQAGKILMEAGYFNETYIADADGQVLAHVDGDVEGFVTHSITIADEPSQAHGKQPAFGLNWLAYFTADRLVNQWMGGYYRKHAKRP